MSAGATLERKMDSGWTPSLAGIAGAVGAGVGALIGWDLGAQYPPLGQAAASLAGALIGGYGLNIGVPLALGLLKYGVDVTREYGGKFLHAVAEKPVNALASTLAGIATYGYLTASAFFAPYTAFAVAGIAPLVMYGAWKLTDGISYLANKTADALRPVGSLLYKGASNVGTYSKGVIDYVKSVFAALGNFGKKFKESATNIKNYHFPPRAAAQPA